MNKAENSDSIPNDLINEIFSRLPAKSVGRFRCVSKLWCSMLHRPYFTELFLTRSSARPRLLVALEGRGGAWRFFSLSQPQNSYEKFSSLVVDADLKLHQSIVRMNCFRYDCPRFSCRYTSGLIYFSQVCHLYEYKDAVHAICNPITGQYVRLPKLRNYGYTELRISFLGFDPIDKQFKVLSMDFPSFAGNKILTIETGKKSWRKIHCPVNHIPLHGDGGNKGICINGILYYLARPVIGISERNFNMLGDTSLVIVCFDVRSEAFKFVDAKGFCDPSATLINYKGKLGGISWNENNAIELNVLKDVEKKEWSKHVYTFWDDKMDNQSSVYVAGVTATGEIVLSVKRTCTSKPIYVFYLNPEENTIQRVEIQGLDEEHGNARVYAFVDHVEDFNLIDAKLFKSRAPKPQTTERGKRKRNGLEV